MIDIVRLTGTHPDFIELLAEYYEAVHVVVRDTAEDIRAFCTDPNSGVWLAYADGIAVGCVVLRPLRSVHFAGEYKRLYVRHAARGRGVAEALLEALEQHARSIGMQWIYLDSHDGLKAAIALYRKRGYENCERYNTNPQATVFLRKHLTQAMPDLSS